MPFKAIATTSAHGQHYRAESGRQLY
jgi:hypothetical protein